ncbi:Zn(2)-C6 fungal-type domain-containing protein [Madurella fahalii]|uniref:Zn(2)-C6 fungal-type domain-containing protein n=1 Tax=Madurella fahalii TaxID=1157608 RepID=A0ABQ0GN82_9PEZI
MDHRGRESGAAFALPETGAAGSEAQPWLPAHDPLLLEFLCSPDSGHSSNTAATNPSAGQVVGPTSCASQAARASRLASSHSDRDAEWFVRAANGIVAPVPPSTSPRISRLFAANRSCRSAARNQRACTPVHYPPPVMHPTGPIEHANWSSFLGLDASASSHPPQPVEDTVNLGSLQPTLGVPYGAPFDTSIVLSTFSQWMSTVNAGQIPTTSMSNGLLPASPEIGTTFGSLSDCGGAELSGIDPNATSMPGFHYALSADTPESHGAVNNNHGLCGCTMAADATARKGRDPNSAPPSSQPCETVPKQSPTSLQIIQYKRSECTRGEPSKKRLLEEVAPQGMACQTLLQTSLEDENGQVKGTITMFGKRTKTRTPPSQEKRLQTAQARREGVCGRCKKDKRQCDLAQKQSPYLSCTLCARKKLYKNVARMPCFKATLEDTLFYRSGPAENEPFFTRRTTVYELGNLCKPDVPVKTLFLTQNVGSHRLTVYAAEFIPLPGDVTSYKWRDVSGEPCAMQMPNFCLTGIDNVHNHFHQYIESAKESYLESLGSEDELASMIARVARDYACENKDSLVADALDLWAISRMIEVPWEICGADTLDIPPIRHFNSPDRESIPIPPTMDTQLDQIAIQRILNPLRARVVRKFEQLITPAKPEAWFEVYLSAFILLNHIERLAKHSAFHAQMHALPSKYSNIAFLEAAFHTAKSILARFHFMCNGSAPLRLDWTSPKTAAMARLEPSQVAFMIKTKSMIADRETDVLNLRKTHQYGKNLYWGGQLFFENWDTSPVHVVDAPAEVPVKSEALAMRARD